MKFARTRTFVHALFFLRTRTCPIFGLVLSRTWEIFKKFKIFVNFWVNGI